MPEASGKVAPTEQFKLEIAIDAEGHYYVNKRRITDERLITLKRAIELTLADNKDPKLIISADRKTPHEAVVRAIDAARQLGLTHLTFATHQSSE